MHAFLFLLFALLFALYYIFQFCFCSFALLSLPWFYSVCSSICFLIIFFLALFLLFYLFLFALLLAIFTLFFGVPLRVHAIQIFCRHYFCPVFNLLYLCNEHYTNRTCFICGRFHVFALSEAPPGMVASPLSYGAFCFSEIF